MLGWGGAPHVEAVTVIFDRKQNLGSLLADFHHHFVRLGMAGAVVKRFLDHASRGQLLEELGLTAESIVADLQTRLS